MGRFGDRPGLDKLVLGVLQLVGWSAVVGIVYGVAYAFGVL